MKEKNVKIYLDNGFSYEGEILQVMPFSHRWIKIKTKNSEINVNMSKVCAIVYDKKHPNK